MANDENPGLMEHKEFNDALAKLLRGLKRDAGVVTVRGGYKGTGRNAARRQIFIRFADGSATDLWLEHGRIDFNGVYDGLRIPAMAYCGTPEESYRAIVNALRVAKGGA